MILRYWDSIGGTLILEFPGPRSGRRDYLTALSIRLPISV
jgi:hypothetical protein